MRALATILIVSQCFYGGGVFTSDAAPAFITVAASDLSAMDVPTVYPMAEFDTTGRTEYNVTTAGGTGTLSGCSNMTNVAGTDNTANFRCMMQNVGPNATLYFPDGTYDFDTAGDGNSVFRPSPTYSNDMGIRCESRTGTHVMLNGLDGRIAGDSTSGNVGIDNGGDWGHKYQGGAASPDYAMNAMLINGSWNTIGGGSANVLDAFMDGSRFEYNAMRAGCDYSGNDGAIAVAAGSGGCGTTATQPGWRFGLHSGAGSTTTVTSTGRVPVRDLTGLVLWNLDDAASCVVTSQTTNSVTCSGGLSGGNSFDATEEFAVSGDNITWTSNSVGIGTAAKDFTGISMPSAPGFTADPGITGGTGTFPYVGADQGGVTALSSQNCLPAYERYNGSC